MRPSTARDRLAALQRPELAVPVGAPEPSRACVASPLAEVAEAPPLPIAERMLAILSAPPSHGEPTAIAYGRKEAELVGLFFQLSPEDAAALRQRLADGATDEVAKAFSRLATERRHRLLAYLAGADRRQLRATGRAHATR